MSKRSSTFTKNDKGEIIETVPGIWSDFDFDFSRAPIFYPLDNLTIEKAVFSSARFYGEADFLGAKFAGDADFGGTEFTDNTRFWGAKFTGNADFTGAEFTGDTDFGITEFTGSTNFWGTKFTGSTSFWDTKFTENAYFVGAEFTENADFGGAEFTENTNFLGAKFTENADFTGAEFAGTTIFTGAYFKKYAPTFADASDAARFSAQVNPQEYRFGAHPKSPHGFSCGEAKLLNRTFILPLDTVLYDPSSWDEQKQDYTRLSEPAQ